MVTLSIIAGVIYSASCRTTIKGFAQYVYNLSIVRLIFIFIFILFFGPPPARPASLPSSLGVGGRPPPSPGRLVGGRPSLASWRSPRLCGCVGQIHTSVHRRLSSLVLALWCASWPPERRRMAASCGPNSGGAFGIIDFGIGQR